jgi:phenylalanyl-tRNA synthetase beta chain
MEVPASTRNADIEKAIASAKQKLLTDTLCFDIFVDPSGEKLPADRKSIAYRFTYRAANRTLTAQEVDEAHKAVLDHLAKQVKGLSYR